jgi:hypothetical protein
MRSRTVFIAATAIVSLTAAVALAAPAVALTTTVYDNTTAGHHLVIKLTDDSDFFDVEITNLTSSDTTWGLAADLTVPGSRTPLWTEDRLGDTATVDIGAGGTITYGVPNWSGQRLSFYTGVPGAPVLVDEYVVPGPFVPGDIHLDFETGIGDIQLGFVPSVTPSTVRAGELPYVTVDGLPDGLYSIYLSSEEQALAIGSLRDLWVPQPGALVVATDVPSTAGHLTASVLIPSGTAPGDYAITIGDPIAGWWPVGPLFTADGVESHATNITVEAGEPRSSTPGEGPLVEPLDQFGQTPVSFAFENVTTPGTTTVSTVTTGPPPTGFQVEGGTYYELSTTAIFDGDVRVCIDYDTTDWVEAEGLWEALRLYHYEGGAWTPLDDPDAPVFGKVCGVTSSFSPFAIGLPDPEPEFWPFEGFLAPVSSSALNTEFAGSIVPFRFRVGENRGLDILAGSPTSVRVNCTTGAPMGAPVVAKSATRAELTYVRASNTYWYFWQTPTTWAGQCRVFTMTLDDGSVHTATFSFKKLTLGALIKAILKAF